MQSRTISSLLTLWSVALLGSGCSDDSPTRPGDPLPPSPTTVIQLEDPPRGAMVESGTVDPSAVTLRGSACDPESPVASLVVAGQPVAVGGASSCADFEVEVQSPWGFNLVEGTATNATGFVSTLTQTFLRSPRYFDPGAASVQEMVEHAFTMRLDQPVIDDGSRVDVDDLATLVERVLSTLDLNDLPTTIAPHPGTRTCDCVWPVPDITVDNTGVRILRDGPIQGGPVRVDHIGLEQDAVLVDLSMNALRVPLKVTGYFSECTISCSGRFWTVEDLYGSIRLDAATISVRAEVSGLDPSGRPDVDVCGSCVDITLRNLRVDVDWAVLSFLLGAVDFVGLEDELMDWAAASLEELLEEQVRDTVPPVLGDFFDSVELPERLALPHPFDVELSVGSRLDHLEIEPGTVGLALAASVRPVDPVRTGPAGSIHRGGAMQTFGAAEFDLGVAPKDDFLNQVFWAAWQGGALDFEDLSALNVPVPDGATLRSSVTLPPVLMPGSGPQQVRIGIGDVFLEAVDGETVVTALYASALVEGSIGFDAGSRTFELQVESDPTLSIQIVTMPEGVDPEAFVAQYEAVFRSMVTTLLVELVRATPIPSLDVGALGIVGVPADLRWVVADGSVVRQDPYTQVTGSVGIE